MWGYIFSRSVERNANLMEDSYYVYDLTILEFDKRNILFQNEKIYLCEIILNNKKKFEVISKRDLCYILVIYTNSDYNLTKNLYDICCPLVNTLDRYVPWLHKSKTVAIYREIIAAIQVNSNWTATHIAAKVGLDLFFMEKNNFKDMDRQFMPDMLTPFHLAIQNVNHNVVQALAQHGASLDLCDVHGFNAFHYASISSPEILMFILSLPGMFERASIRTNKGCTPLHLACYAHKLENIHILLRFGLSVSMLTVTPPHELEHIASSNNINVKKKKQSNDFVDVVVKFNDKEIDEFELDFMFYGGTPLHWTKKHNEVERFIALGFDVDAINAKGETALLLKTRRMRFKCMITLLVEQANVDIPDSFGNSALHYAAMLGDISITQSLVVFDGNVDHINRYQVSVRHLASTAKRENETEDNNYKMVLYVITAIGAKRCPITMKGCNDGCSYQGTFDGKRYVHWPIFSNAKFYRNVQIEEMVRLKLNNLANEPLKNRKKLVNMLSFDGGGVKGLITIQMLHELEKRLKHKFIDYFDWVTGTSTGSIISVALVLGKDIQSIRALYFRFKDKVMKGPRPFNSELIEQLLMDEIGDVKMNELYTKYGKFVMIPTTMVDRFPVQLHLFRSYPKPSTARKEQIDVDAQFLPFPDSSEQLVWQAVRASCAAPTYFQAWANRFVDGGILANNPTMDMLVEFSYFNRQNNEKDKQLNVVVSFGTGEVQPKPFTLPDLNKLSWHPNEMRKNINYVKDMFTIIIDSACNTDYHVVERCESWCSCIPVPFFRLNPDLIEIIALHEIEDAEIINCMWVTKVYMYSKRKSVDELVELLELSFDEKTKDNSIEYTKSKTSANKLMAIKSEPKLIKMNESD